MSMQSVEGFFERVAEDEVLQEKMKKLASENQDETLATAYCALAAEQGEAFTVEELVQFTNKASQQGGELDDAALEQVNAGSFWTNILRDLNNVHSWIYDNVVNSGSINPAEPTRKAINRRLGYNDPD